VYYSFNEFNTQKSNTPTSTPVSPELREYVENTVPSGEYFKHLSKESLVSAPKVSQSWATKYFKIVPTKAAIDIAKKTDHIINDRVQDISNTNKKWNYSDDSYTKIATSILGKKLSNVLPPIKAHLEEKKHIELQELRNKEKKLPNEKNIFKKLFQKHNSTGVIKFDQYGNPVQQESKTNKIFNFWTNLKR